MYCLICSCKVPQGTLGKSVDETKTSENQREDCPLDKDELGLLLNL